MASVKNLKKDMNYAFAGVIEAVYIWEIANGGKQTDASNALINEAIASFDALISKVNANVENKKAHFKQVNAEFESTIEKLVDSINKL